MISECRAIVDLEFGGENRSNQEERNLSQCHFVHYRHIWIGLGSNSFFRDKRKGRRHVKQPEGSTCDFRYTKQQGRGKTVECFHTAVFKVAKVYPTNVRVAVTFCPDREQ